jgi:drug/metabolite transporter (DMT)-like permease
MPELLGFPLAAALWMAGQGIMHFVIGRFFNYRASQLVGVNLSAPVVQLQVVVAMVLAVLTMHEPFTGLQSIGAVLMLGGSFLTQKHSVQGATKAATKASSGPVVAGAIPRSELERMPAFRPHHFAGYLCSSCAAIAYGISPLMVRLAFDAAPQASVIAGAVIAYAAATFVFSLALLRPRVRRDIGQLKRENVPWFLYAAVFLSWLLNREYEVLNISVIVGSAAAIIGSILVSMSTDFVVSALGLPDPISAALRFRLAG